MQVLARNGMHEMQPVGMEVQPLPRAVHPHITIVVRPVFAVAEDRVAEGGEMHAYLILAPRVEPSLDQRVAFALLQHTIVCDGKFAVPVPHAAGDRR